MRDKSGRELERSDYVPEAGRVYYLVLDPMANTAKVVAVRVVEVWERSYLARLSDLVEYGETPPETESMVGRFATFRSGTLRISTDYSPVLYETPTEAVNAAADGCHAQMESYLKRAELAERYEQRWRSLLK